MDAFSRQMKDESKTEQLRLEEIHAAPQVDPLISGEDPRVKKIKRKVDLRLSLILALMYVVNQVYREVTPKYLTLTSTHSQVDRPHKSAKCVSHIIPLPTAPESYED